MGSRGTATYDDQDCFRSQWHVAGLSPSAPWAGNRPRGPMDARSSHKLLEAQFLHEGLGRKTACAPRIADASAADRSCSCGSGSRLRGHSLGGDRGTRLSGRRRSDPMESVADLAPVQQLISDGTARGALPRTCHGGHAHAAVLPLRSFGKLVSSQHVDQVRLTVARICQELHVI